MTDMATRLKTEQVCGSYRAGLVTDTEIETAVFQKKLKPKSILRKPKNSDNRRKLTKILKIRYLPKCTFVTYVFLILKLYHKIATKVIK
jgi:hypothetical protein